MLLGFVCVCIRECVYSLYVYMSTGKASASSVIAFPALQVTLPLYKCFVLISEKTSPVALECGQNLSRSAKKAFRWKEKRTAPVWHPTDCHDNQGIWQPLLFSDWTWTSIIYPPIPPLVRVASLSNNSHAALEVLAFISSYNIFKVSVDQVKMEHINKHESSDEKKGDLWGEFNIILNETNQPKSETNNNFSFIFLKNRWD